MLNPHIEDPKLQVSFDLPEGLVAHQATIDGVNAKFTTKSAAGEPCVMVDALGSDPAVFRQIIVYRFNGDCVEGGVTQERVRATALRSLKGILHRSGAESMTSPIDYELGSGKASAVSGNVYSVAQHGILFGEMTCAALQKDMGCWAFLSSTPAKTAALATMPVRIAGGAPVAAIPESMSHFVELPTLTYHDDQLHISLEYPGDFASVAPRTQERLHKAFEEFKDNAVQTHAVTCLKVTLSADELRDDARSNLTVMNFDAACSGLKTDEKTFHQWVVGVAKSAATHGNGNMSAPTYFRIGSHEMSVFQETMHPANAKVDVQLVEICTTAAGDFVCFQFSSTATERLRFLAGSKVSFPGGETSPLVPRDVLDKLMPKP